MVNPTKIDLMISNGIIITVDDSRRVLNDGAIAIDSGRILAVGSSKDIKSQFQAKRNIDASDHILMPGLVDAHVHITAEHLARNLAPDDAGSHWMKDYALPLYATINPEEERLGASLACLEMIRNGTTTFAEGGTARDISASVDAVTQSGMRGVLSPWTADLTELPVELRMTSEQALQKTIDAIDCFHGTADGRIAIATSCITPTLCSPTLLKDLKALADSRQTTFTFHHGSLAETVDQYVAIHARRPLIDFAEMGILGPNVRATHMVHIDNAEFAVLCESGTSVAHCPQSAYRLAYGIAPHGRFPEMVAAGVPLVLGTDGVMSSGHQDLFKTMKIAAGLYKDMRQDASLMPAEKIIEMVTIVGARCLGMDSKIGSLEAGKQADLIMLDRRAPELTPLLEVVNALVYASDGRNVSHVMVNGELLMEDGVVCCLDSDALYAQAELMAPILVDRAGLAPRPRWVAL